MYGWPELVMKTRRVYTISDNEDIRVLAADKASVKYIYCNKDLFFFFRRAEYIMEQERC